MGYFDQILEPKLDPIILHKRMLEENLKFKNEQLKQSLLDNPEHANTYLAQLSRTAMPDKVAAKMAQNANLDKALLAIPEGDPRREMIATMAKDMPDIIRRSPYGANPSTAIMKEVQSRDTALKPEVYKYIQDNSGLFGKKVASAEGYDEWAEKNPVMKNPLSYGAEGLATQAIGLGLSSAAVAQMLKKLPEYTAKEAIPILGKTFGLRTGLAALGRGLTMTPPIGAPGILAKLLGGGLMAATAFAGMDAVKNTAARAGHPLSLPEELAVGLPIFGGVSKAARVGGRMIDKEVASLTRNMPTGMDIPESSGLAATRALNQFDRLASPGTKFTMKDGQVIEEAIPGKLVGKQPVGRDDIAAVAKAERISQEEAALRQVKEDSYRKLSDDDLKAITLEPEREAEIKASAYARNKLAGETAEREALETTRLETVAAAEHLIKEGTVTDMPSALVMAKRLVAPDMEQTVKDSAFLKEKFGFTDEQLSTLSARERAEFAVAWEKHALPSERQLVVRDEILPPAVKDPEKVIINRQNASITRSPGQKLYAGADNWVPGKPLPATGTQPLTKTVEQTAAENNAATIERVRAKIDGIVAGKKPMTTVPTGEQLNRATDISHQIKVGNIAAVTKDVVDTVKEAGSSIVRNSKTAKEKVEGLNRLDQMITQKADELIAKHKMGSVSSNTFLAELSKAKQANRALIGKKEVEALEQEAVKETKALVGGMIPENSATGMAIAKDTQEQLIKQKHKEWRAIFGRKDKVTPEEFAANKDKIEAWMNKWSKAAKYGIPAAGALMVGSAMLPDNADAAVAMRAGAVAVESLAKTVAESTGKATDDVVKQLYNAGYGAPVVSEDGHGIVKLMRSMSFAPKSANVFPKTKANLWDKVLSPHHRDDIHMDARYANGERAPYSIAKEVGLRSQVILANADATLASVNKIMKDAGVEQNLEEIALHMKPLVDKFHKVVDLENPYWLGRADMLDSVIKGKYTSAADSEMKRLSQLLRASKGETKNLDPEYQEMYKVINANREEALANASKLKPALEEFEKEYETYAKTAAEKWSTARVAYAVEGTGMGKDGWLEPMLSASERQAAEEIRAINRVYAVRMKETGHDVIAGPYIHHPAHPDVNYADDLKYADNMSGNDGAEAMRMVNFFHRSSGSKLMIPDTHYIMGKYVPDANKRIEISDMWKMGRPGGWDAVRKEMQAKGGYDGALKLIDDIRTAFDPMDTSGSAKWLNRYAAFEVARLLTLSPSVSFKHALKLMGNWTIFPADISAKATAENFSLNARQLAQDMSGELYKGKDRVADLSRALTHMHHTYAAVSDMAPYELPTSAIDTFLTKWNKAGSTFVNGVERWDRGQTFISAMMMAQKKGMTPEQAMYGLMDSVLRVNFLTGANNPKWLKDPYIRTMMMFQGTPFKILEQRAMTGYQGGKDILNVLSKIKSDVIKGEENFKWHMLNDEMLRSDAFGNKYATQFLKQMLVLGTVIGTGKYAFDSDLWGHAIHFPGLQLGEKGMQLGVNPLVSAAYRTGKEVFSGKEMDEFWMSSFFNKWLGQTGFPAIAHKVARLKDDDIPQMYKDSKLSYLFGVPRIKEE